MDSSTLQPAEVAVAIIQQAVTKHNTQYDKVFVKAILAGVILSFGSLFDFIVQGGSPSLTSTNPGIVKLLGGFVFPVGLVAISLQGFELLTSNLMIFPMAVLNGSLPWWSIPTNWVIVFFGNFCGSLLSAALLAKSDGLVGVDPYAAYIRNFAVTRAVTPTWYQIFLKGIGCNWLVCIGFWQATGARETISKIVSLWLPIWAFVTCGFDHMVVNMFKISLGIMLRADLTPAYYIKKSLIASFLGNLVGASFVGLPAVYFYFGASKREGLVNAEEGCANCKGLDNSISSGQSSVDVHP